MKTGVPKYGYGVLDLSKACLSRCALSPIIRWKATTAHQPTSLHNRQASSPVRRRSGGYECWNYLVSAHGVDERCHSANMSVIYDGTQKDREEWNRWSLNWLLN